MMVLQIVENLVWHSSSMWTGGENVTISLCFQLQTKRVTQAQVSDAGGGGGGRGVVRQLWMLVFVSWISIDLSKSPSEKNT